MLFFSSRREGGSTPEPLRPRVRHCTRVILLHAFFIYILKDITRFTLGHYAWPVKRASNRCAILAGSREPVDTI